MIGMAHDFSREIAMPPKAKHSRKPHAADTRLAILVERYDAHIDATINHNVYVPQSAWGTDEEDPVYRYTSKLEITGIATYPPQRADDIYELTIYGDDAPSRHHNLTLRDVQARDNYGSPIQRLYRGRQIPVYNAPKGLGHIEKVRGELRWTGWLFVPTRFVNDMLVLLNHARNLFVALYERKEDRARRIMSISLQTKNPEEE